jgi:hypothetical protein
MTCRPAGCCRYWLAARPRNVPANLFLASTYLGFLSGIWLGTLGGLLLAIPVVYVQGDTGYAVYQGGFAVVTGLVIGAVVGLVVGLLNGSALTALSHTAVLRSRTGISRNRLTIVAAVTTGLGTFSLLYLLLKGTGGLLAYSPALAGALLAVPMSRRLRLP